MYIQSKIFQFTSNEIFNVEFTREFEFARIVFTKLGVNIKDFIIRSFPLLDIFFYDVDVSGVTEIYKII